MAGSIFATLILHTFNIFNPIAIINKLPTEVIYVTTLSLSIFDNPEAPKVIIPSYKNTATLENKTPTPIDATKNIEATPSSTDLANNTE